MLYCNKLFRMALLVAVMMSAVPVAHGMKGRQPRSCLKYPTTEGCLKELQDRYDRLRLTMEQSGEQAQAEIEKLKKLDGPTRADYEQVVLERQQLATQNTAFVETIKSQDIENCNLKRKGRRNTIICLPFMAHSIYTCAQHL